jgi:hypothetical protein
MKISKLIFFVFVLSFPYSVFAQAKISPYISSGFINHLGRNGINSEIGIDFDFLKKLNLAGCARYSILAKNTSSEVEIKAASVYLSFILLNKNNNKLMVGPGLSHGTYKRYTRGIGFEKEYSYYWVDFLKIRYDYFLSEHAKIGLNFSLTDDDGDGSTFLGLVVGYVF